MQAKKGLITIFAITGLFILIQFIPVKRDNPVIANEIVAPQEVKDILVKSCYDCHSNATKWPTYSMIAPISWLVTHDVNEAREHLNFSDWESFDNIKKIHSKSGIIYVVQKDIMPLKYYLLMHKNAALTADEKTILINWANAADSTVIN